MTKYNVFTCSDTMAIVLQAKEAGVNVWAPLFRDKPGCALPGYIFVPTHTVAQFRRWVSDRHNVAPLLQYYGNPDLPQKYRMNFQRLVTIDESELILMQETINGLASADTFNIGDRFELISDSSIKGVVVKFKSQTKLRVKLEDDNKYTDLSTFLLKRLN